MHSFQWNAVIEYFQSYFVSHQYILLDPCHSHGSRLGYYALYDDHLVELAWTTVELISIPLIDRFRAQTTSDAVAYPW
jgi:hypothetical protein